MKTNEYIKDVMISLICTYEPIVQSIRRRKLKWYGHTIIHDNLSKTIVQCMVAGNRKCGRPKWNDNIKEWSKLNQSDLSHTTTTNGDGIVEQLLASQLLVSQLIDFPYYSRVKGIK